MIALRSQLRSILGALLLTGATQDAYGAALLNNPPAILVVAVSGGTSVERLGERHLLQIGEAVVERDVVHLDANAHLGVRLPEGGVIELGPRTELSIEKLPPAAQRKDRKSIFNLGHGFLRIVSTPADAEMPLYLYFNGQRASLGEGEFFFESAPMEAKVCVASGKLIVTPIIASKPRSLLAASCYLLAKGEEPRSLARDSKVWDNMRRNFGLDLPALTVARVANATTKTPAGTTAGPSASAESGLKPSSASLPVTAMPSMTNAGRSLDIQSEPGLPAAPSSPSSLSIGAANSAASAGAGWAINIASYFDRATADQRALALRSSSYAAFVQTALVEGRPRYRVQVRGFASIEAAQQQMQMLKDKPGYANIWIVRAP